MPEIELYESFKENNNICPFFCGGWFILPDQSWKQPVSVQLSGDLSDGVGAGKEEPALFGEKQMHLTLQDEREADERDANQRNAETVW